MTLPALMHDVQTFKRVGDPFTSARTRWMLGFQRRLFRRWENVTDLPNQGFLPQMSHTAAIDASRLPERSSGLRDAFEVLAKDVLSDRTGVGELEGPVGSEEHRCGLAELAE